VEDEGIEERIKTSRFQAAVYMDMGILIHVLKKKKEVIVGESWKVCEVDCQI
jgi:hypothetical protein